MIRDWIGAFRPKTLTAAVIPVVVGSALAFVETEQFTSWISLLAMLSAASIQIGTNLFNDALDFKKGADTHERVGPKRVTQAGVFSYKQVMLAAVVSFTIALLLAIPLVAVGGWPIVAIGLCSLLMGYCYTGGPFPLAYKGLGDLFVIVFFGIVAVSGVYYLQTLSWSLSAVIAGLQVGSLATVLIAINNLRDLQQDILADKRTLAVRFGRVFTIFEIGFLFLLSFLLGGYWGLTARLAALLLPLLLTPFAAMIILNVIKARTGEQYNNYLAQTAKVHVFFGILLSIGLLL